MASGSRSAVEMQPPALPVKKHRSNSLSPCSVDADCLVLSQVGLQHQTYTHNEVFSEPTDCHADRCPIHQRYDRFQHLERFFSDGTPPPVPRKQLARTLSLPGIAAPPLSPLPPPSPLQAHPLDFDNPLYMLAPTPDAGLQEASGGVDAAPSGSRLLPFSQLSFDTPDEHLPYLFRAIDDQRAVSQGIQHRHLLFLRSTVQSAEAEVLLREEASEKDVGSYRPQDFLLCEGGAPKQMGDSVYYRLQSPRFPGRVLGLKVHKQTDGPPSAHNKHRWSHVNVQDVIAHFQPSNNPRKEFLSCTAPNPPHKGSTEPPIHLTDTSLPSAQAFLLQGHSMSVERDLPHVTLEDFINGCSSLQSSECLGYDRQVCVLLVQILTGLQHLSNVSAAAAELRPRDILLVWPSRERHEGRSDAKDGMEWEKTESKGPIQMLWRTHGSPRVVLTPHSGPHFLPSVQSQIVALIQFCLHRQGGSLSKSVYRRGLVYLLSLFQGENPGPQLADMVAMLQVLLWGPHVSLFNLRSYTTTTVQNWLTIKRALLVMKLAEKGLIQDQSALGWEDFMCLQYLSFTDAETIVSVTSQLWLNV